MDKNPGEKHVSEKPSLQPQWLSKTNGSSLLGVLEKHAKGKIDSKNNNSLDGHQFPFGSSKKVPPMISFLGKSKSSSHLLDVETKKETKSSVERILTEKESFEKEFPSLSKGENKKSSSIQSRPNRWSQTENIAGKLVNHLESKDNSPTSSNITAEELEIQKLRCLVPNVSQTNPKARPDFSKRSYKQDSSRSSSTKKGFKPHFVRKAVSESSLPLSTQQQERYARILASTKKNQEHPKKTANVETKKSDRNQPPQIIPKLRKKESSWKTLDSVKEEIESKEENESTNSKSVCVSERKKPSDKIEMNLSPEKLQEWKKRLEECSFMDNNTKQFTIDFFGEDDEEKFLRNLGWVPDEECHIPELTEEEIRSVDFNALKQTRFGSSFKIC